MSVQSTSILPQIEASVASESIPIGIDGVFKYNENCAKLFESINRLVSGLRREQRFVVSFAQPRWDVRNRNLDTVVAIDEIRLASMHGSLALCAEGQRLLVHSYSMLKQIIARRETLSIAIL